MASLWPQIMAQQYDWHKQQIETIHEFLDKKGIPRSCGDGNESYTILYRIKLFEDVHLRSLSEIENYYLRNNALVD